MAGKPAARLGDPTAHGGAITGPGVPTVLIGKMPAATMGDMHVCPMVTPATPPIPHVGGPIALGSTGVFIGKKPAARMGDMAVCVGPPSSVIMGCPTVLIGEVGSGSQAGSAGDAAAATAAALKGPKLVNALKLPDRSNQLSEVSDIQVFVKDSAGKPLAGAGFFLEDPDGVRHLVATDSQGRFKRPGPWKKGQAFKVIFRSVTLAKFDKSELKDGDACVLSAKVEGYPNGTAGTFRLVALAPKGERQLHSFSGVVKNERMECRWIFHSEEMREILGADTPPEGQSLKVRLVVVCGHDSCVGNEPCALKFQPLPPVVVNKLRSA